MLVRSLLVLSTLGAGSGLAASPAQPRTADARATAVADRVMEALGGDEAWSRTRYLRFDFAVEREGKTVVRRSHSWDKWTGRYRLEATTREAEPYVVLMNINTKAGRAWLKGAELHGEEAKKYLEQGHAIWVNDTYWLLMPYKMKDPGVILTLDGVEKKGADAWDKVLLTFDNVGLTPKDRYWAYVNRKTGLVERWDYVLKGEAKPPTTFTWRNWKKYGKLMLADDRQNPADGTRIYFPVLEVPDSLADTVFIAP
jgi:hypothetical protein